MLHPQPLIVGHFVMPKWWTQPAFAVREMAEFIDAPIVSVERWLDISRIAGHPLGAMRGGRRFYDCHAVYIIALLGKLRRARVPVSDRVIVAAHAFAYVDGKPRAPGYIETWDIDGDALIRVPAWLAWTEVRAMATPQFGLAHGASDTPLA